MTMRQRCGLILLVMIAALVLSASDAEACNQPAGGRFGGGGFFSRLIHVRQWQVWQRLPWNQPAPIPPGPGPGPTPPTPPVPPVPPTPPVDFNVLLAQAYAADATANKADLVAKLAAFYTTTSLPVIANPAYTTTAQLNAALKPLLDAIAPPPSLPVLWPVIVAELDATLGNSSAPLDDPTRAAVKAEFVKIGTALNLLAPPGPSPPPGPTPPVPPVPPPTPVPPTASATTRHSYCWGGIPNGGQQIALYDGNDQIGCYSYATGFYGTFRDGEWRYTYLTPPCPLPTYDPLRHFVAEPGDHMHQCSMGHCWYHRGSAAQVSVHAHTCPVCGMQDYNAHSAGVQAAPVQAHQPLSQAFSGGGCANGNCSSSGGGRSAILPWRR
jgi:hypothetical protein